MKTPQCLKRQATHTHGHVHMAAVGADPRDLAEHTPAEQPVAAGAEPAAVAKATIPDGDPVDMSQVRLGATVNTGLLAELYKSAVDRAAHVQAIEDIDGRLRQLVPTAFAQGITVRPIMEALGVSKSRVYQIRDGRR